MSDQPPSPEHGNPQDQQNQPRQRGQRRQDDQPSWMTYAAPMRSVRDGHDPTPRPRDWEGQRVAAARGPTQWGFAAFFTGYGAFYLASLLITALTAGTLADFDSVSPPHNIGPLVLVAFVPNLLLGLAPAIFSWWRGQGPRRDFGLVPTWRDLRVGLACGGISLGLGLVVNLLVLWLTRTTPDTNGLVPNLGTLSGGQTIWLAIAVLFIFVGAPLTEELLVRGALWGALEHYRVNRYAILALTALLFAFMHQDPTRTLALFCQGVALGSARMITGRIGSSMIAHATNNLLPAVLLFVLAR
ncbi:MAG TPA: type II CAAX endopeptidase family protein [Pseudonocardiaceae bacterium]